MNTIQENLFKINFNKLKRFKSANCEYLMIVG